MKKWWQIFCLSLLAFLPACSNPPTPEEIEELRLIRQAQEVELRDAARNLSRSYASIIADVKVVSGNFVNIRLQPSFAGSPRDAGAEFCKFAPTKLVGGSVRISVYNNSRAKLLAVTRCFDKSGEAAKYQDRWIWD